MPAQNVSNINVKVDLIFPTVLGLNLPTFWYNPLSTGYTRMPSNFSIWQ
jgi:hypothetical protein